MPFFPKSKVIYVHIPKTGGSSVEQVLAEKEGIAQWPLHSKIPGPHRIYLFGPSTSLSSYPLPSLAHHSLQHCTWAELQVLLKDKDLSDCTVVATLRDPLSKIVSEIKFQMTHFRLFPGMPSFKEMGRAPFEVFRNRFNELVWAKLEAFKTNPHLDDNHWLPQVEFLKGSDGTIDPKIQCVHLSSLSKGMEKIFGPSFVLPHTQKSKKIHPGHGPDELFEEELIKEVKRVYKEDFEFLETIL